MKFFKYAAKEFRIDPRQLKTEHVEAYFHHKITERLNRGVEPKVIAKRIDNELSHLKFFAWWISKPNCIPKFSKIMKAETFRLENCPMSNFRSSHTDTSALRKKVNDAFKINDYLGVQVMAMAYFGLRPAESVSLEHQESFCSEGGRPFIHADRKLSFSAEAAAVGPAAKALNEVELGSRLKFRGFLTTSSARSRKLVLHITEFEKE